VALAPYPYPCFNQPANQNRVSESTSVLALWLSIKILICSRRKPISLAAVLVKYLGKS
jgi:hypothetical protein